MSTGSKLARSNMRLRELTADLAQIVFDIAGVVDPTPISDGAGAVVSVLRGDWLGAGISLISMVPYVGDLAKAGKFPRYLKTLENAISLASESADAARVLQPVMERVKQAVDLLPSNGGAQLARIRSKVDDYFRTVGTRAAAHSLPDIRKQYQFRKFDQNGYSYHEASGRLGVPGKVKRFRSKSSQSSISSGTGDDAGHLIGDRFGAPGGTENLTAQNWVTNRHGTFKQLENQWARKLQQGTGVDVKVVDVAKHGETRPFARRVQWTEISPSGQTSKHELTFMNPHTPRSREMQDIAPTVTQPQVNNVIHVDFGKRQ